MKSSAISRRLACFSPLVMLLTFCFEFAAAAFVAWRYKLNRRALLIIAILVNLGIFQIAEWNICAQAGAEVWGRIGFIGTAILIPLGLGLIHSLHRSRYSGFLTVIFSIATAIFVGWFALVPESVTIVFCGGNYSIFRLTDGLWEPYAVFYWLGLLISVVLTLYSARQVADQRLKRALMWFTVGYLSFIGPTLVSNALAPETLKAIPSILCGFAVFLALILVTIVAPASLQRRKK